MRLSNPELDEDRQPDWAIDHGSVTVYVAGCVCYCGAAWKQQKRRRFDHGYWLKAGDLLEMRCKRGHVIMARFVIETVTEAS